MDLGTGAVVIVQVDVDPELDPAFNAEYPEPDRIQVALKTVGARYRARGFKGPTYEWRGTTPRRWLINMAGAVYYADEPDNIY